MSDTIYFFVASRILLGLAGGVIIPVGQSVLLGEYPEKLRTFGVGLWGVLSMMPFMAGHLSRRLVFGISRLALFVLLQHSGRVAGRRRRGFAALWPRVSAALPAFRLRWFFLAGGDFFGLQTIFNMGNDFDWFHSPILVVALIVVVLALPCFIIWELGERHPAIDMRLFGQRNYAIATICSVVGFFVIQGSLSIFVSSDATASRLQLVPRRRRLSFDAAFVRAVRRHRARTVQARRRPLDLLSQFPWFRGDADLARPVRQNRLLRSDRLADDLFRLLARDVLRAAWRISRCMVCKARG